jgi:hypothetical protein
VHPQKSGPVQLKMGRGSHPLPRSGNGSKINGPPVASDRIPLGFVMLAGLSDILGICDVSGAVSVMGSTRPICMGSCAETLLLAISKAVAIARRETVNNTVGLRRGGSGFYSPSLSVLPPGGIKRDLIRRLHWLMPMQVETIKGTLLRNELK